MRRPCKTLASPPFPRKHARSFSLRKIAGDVFMESLIGVLLMAWLGAGMAYCANRILAARADTKIINATVLEMKQVLHDKGESLCGTSPSIAIFSKQVTLKVTCFDANPIAVLSAAGSASIVPPKKVALSAKAEDLGLSKGDDVVVSSGEML